MTKKPETIYETAKETAKKIRQALKKGFPQTRFSVTSDHDSVTVRWTDGPMKPEIEEILNGFKSLGPSDMSDYRAITGYVIDGQRYVGASYLNAERTLTPEYKARILEQASKMGYKPDVYGTYLVHELNRAEMAVLGRSVQQAAPLLSSNVIDLDERRAEKVIRGFTPEQHLKLLILNKLLGADEVASVLAEGRTIDELFAKAAEVVIEQNINPFPE